MITREYFATLPTDDKLQYLFDEIVQMRQAGVVTGSMVEDLRKRLAKFENTRRDSAS